jgi:hypothetical protein
MFLLVGAASAHAGLVSVTGAGQILPDASAAYAANAFNDTVAIVNAWNEKQDQTLSADLRVDAFGVPGTYGVSNAANLTIAAGTMVDSHYFYFDPKSTKSVGTNANNQVTFGFDQKILGLIYTSTSNANSKLKDSDHLILVGSSPGHFNARGFESGDDFVTVIDPYTISFKLTASSPGDQIRVVTEAVPEPGTMAALALGAAGILRRRRKA